MKSRGSFVSSEGPKEPRVVGVVDAGGWQVRGAGPGDVAAVAAAVEALLSELGGRRPSRPALEAEVEVLLEDPSQGAILVADAGEGQLAGVLAASWIRAIHAPGRYLVVEDLWVDPAWRSAGVGAGLMDAVVLAARAQGAARLEVGLPRESFAAIARTEAFYSANGFEHLGPRMRRLLG